MPVTSTVARVSFAGADSPGPFAIPFYFLDDTHVRATKRDAAGNESTLVLTTSYTLTGAGDEAGGSLTMAANLATGETLVIERNVPLTQETEYTRNDPFPASAANDVADKSVMIDQQQSTDISRSLRLTRTSVDGSGTYNANGNAITGLSDTDITDTSAAVNVGGLANYIAAHFGSDLGGLALAAALLASTAGYGASLMTFNWGDTDSRPMLQQEVNKVVRDLRTFPGVSGLVADDQIIGLNEALRWASQNKGKLVGKAGDVYTANAMTQATFTTDGSTKSFVVSNARCKYAENFQVRYRSNALGTGVNGNSGQVLRPGIDFTWDYATKTITTTIAYAAVDANNLAVDEGLYITGDNFELDGNGCIFTGTARLWAVGAPTTQGQAPPLDGIQLRNFRLEAVGSWACPRGVQLQWCRNSLIENVRKRGYTGTDFNLYYCWDSEIRNCVDVGSASGFGCLIYGCLNSGVNGFVCTDLGAPGLNAWSLAVQIKGGNGCYGKRIHVINVNAGSGTGDYALYCRGDDPYDAAGTTKFGVYPYPTGDWFAADDQRQSRGTVWEDNTVEYTSDYAGTKLSLAMQCQEFNDATVSRLRMINCGGIKANRTTGGTEAILRINDCSGVGVIGTAVSVNGKDSTHQFAGLTLTRPYIHAGTTIGIGLTSCDRPTIDTPMVDACGSDGIKNTTCIDTQIHGGYSKNNTGKGLNQVAHDLTSQGVKVVDIDLSGNTGGNTVGTLPGIYTGITPNIAAVTHANTTAQTYVSMTIPSGTKWAVETEHFAQDTTSFAVGRYCSWQAVNGIGTPTAAAFSTATTGGSLTAATYYYRVSAITATGEGLAFAEQSQVVPAGTATNTVTVNWVAVTGATGYRVYGRTTGAEQLIATVGAVTTYTDTGAISPSGALPNGMTGAQYDLIKNDPDTLAGASFAVTSATVVALKFAGKATTKGELHAIRCKRMN